MGLQRSVYIFGAVLIPVLMIYMYSIGGTSGQGAPLDAELARLRGRLNDIESGIKEMLAEGRREVPATATTTTSSSSSSSTSSTPPLPGAHRNKWKETLRTQRGVSESHGWGNLEIDERKHVPGGDKVRVVVLDENRRAGGMNLSFVTLASDDIPEIAGKVKVVAAAVMCNCPALDYGGRATEALYKKSLGAYIHARPFMPDLGDVEGVVDLTKPYGEACSGQEVCQHKLSKEAASPVSGCLGKVSLDYTCDISGSDVPHKEEIMKLLEHNILFTTHIVDPAPGRHTMEVSCSASVLSKHLKLYLKRMGSPWGRALVNNGGHTEKHVVETTDLTARENHYSIESNAMKVDWVRPVSYKWEGKRFNIWPVQFSMPSPRYLSSLKWKNEGELAFAPSIPGNKATYKYTPRQGFETDAEPDEQYFKEYRHSYYCVTRKKKGWDCLRHYEILSQGCVPYFIDLEKLPAATMPFFPKKLVLEAMNLPGVKFNNDHKGSFLNSSAFSIDFSIFDKERYYRLAAQIQNHARRYLTSEAMARYVLRALAQEGGPKKPKKVLFIHHCYHDFMGDSLWTGFKELEAKGRLELVADIVPTPDLSTGGANSKAAHLATLEKCDNGRKNALLSSAHTLTKPNYYKGNPYGGWGNHRALNNPLKETIVNQSTIPDRIRAKEFDVIVYGTVVRTDAWIELVREHYDKNQIAMIYGADGVEVLHHYATLVKQGTFFTRENYDEPGGYLHGKTCSDGPGIAEAHGFDCCSWDYGGSRIVWSGVSSEGSDWKHCAKENSRCECSGEARFGDPVRNLWSQVTFSDKKTFNCKNINADGPFVDPAPGLSKVCQCLVRNGQNTHLLEGKENK